MRPLRFKSGDVRNFPYLPLESQEEISDSSKKVKQATQMGQILVLAMTAVCSGLFGLLLGAQMGARSSAKTCVAASDIGDIQLQVMETSFAYNRTFGENPTTDENTQAAWDSIIPLGQGTVRYPPDTLQISTLSVVHQLHCLWSVHQNYYRLLNGEDVALQAGILPHVRHCVDYLRQSLICAADSTLEPVVPELGGVTGWGVSRRCRNYQELRLWAEGLRVNNLSGFL